MNSIIKKYTDETNDRVVTSAEPNTTRDSIAVNLNIDGTHIKLIDTAGITGSISFFIQKINKNV